MRQAEKLVGSIYGKIEQSHRRKSNEMPLIHIARKHLQRRYTGR
jgi:hypothetical protein